VKVVRAIFEHLVMMFLIDRVVFAGLTKKNLPGKPNAY
jgi:hypothetical protein